jgi:hypothetical protein
LFSSNIGSEKARGRSTTTAAPALVMTTPSSLPREIQDLVQYLYNEATRALTSSIAAKITDRGIETPLGILSLEQVEKGEKVLSDLGNLLKVKLCQII